MSASTQDRRLQVKNFNLSTNSRESWHINWDKNRVPNALPGRDSLDVEIFGMEGIPEEDMIAHEMRIAGNNQSNSGSKKSKTGGSGQYGELTFEQIQQQMEARKSSVPAYTQQDYYGYSNYAYPDNAQYYQNGFPPPPQQQEQQMQQAYGYTGR